MKLLVFIPGGTNEFFNRILLLKFYFLLIIMYSKNTNQEIQKKSMIKNT